MTLLGSFLLFAGVAAQAQVDVPTPALPAANATNVPLTAHFLWRPISGAVRYEIELAYDAAFEQPAYGSSTEASELDVADLWDDTTYYWHVRAVDTLDSLSAWSAPRSFHTIIIGAPRPTSPTDRSSDIPVDQVSLTFAFPTNPPTGFEAMYAFDPTFRSGVSITVPAASRTASMTGLPYDTTVYWRARVAGGAAAGPGSWSHVMRFRTISAPPVQLGECTPLAPSTGITIQDALISSVWTGPSGSRPGALYQVRFSQDNRMSEGMLTFDEIDTTALVVALPEGSATWYWQVRAIATDDGVIDGPWSAISWFRVEEPVRQALDAPALLLPANHARSRSASVSLSWDSVAGGESYEIEIGRDTTFETSDALATTGRRWLQIDSLRADTLYAWRVRAVAGRGQNRGPWSEPFYFSTAASEPMLPGGISLIAPMNESAGLDPFVGFRWESALDATVHQLQVSDDSTFTTGAREFGAFDTTTSVLLDEGRRWWWRVRGINAAGSGAWSPVWTFTTAVGTTRAPEHLARKIDNLRIVPLPATTTATVIATLPPGEQARLTVMSMTGEVAYEQMLQADGQGGIRIELPTGTLPSGVYRCSVRTRNGETLEAPLVIAH